MALPIAAAASRLVSNRARYRRGGANTDGRYTRTPRRVGVPAQEVHYRITGAKKIILIGLAVFFDMLPFAGIIVGGTFLALSISDMGIIDRIIYFFSGSMALAFAPILYMLLSGLSVIVAGFVMPIIFTLCGYRSIGVSVKKMSINITTFIMKAMPILNILPIITITTFAHIHLSRVEDRQRARKRRGR
jgi:hypothetical protein